MQLKTSLLLSAFAFAMLARVVAAAPGKIRHVPDAARLSAELSDGGLGGWEVACAARPLSLGRDLPRDVRLLPMLGAQVEPGYTSNLPVGAQGEKIPVQSITVESGRVDVVLPASDAQRGALLSGPEKILLITTAGRASMVVTETHVVIAALEGAALAGVAGKFRPLSPGEVRKFERKTAKVDERRVVSAPELHATSSLDIALEGPKAVDVHLTAPSGALEVVVSTFKDGGVRAAVDQIVPVSEASSGKVTFQAMLPRAGTYFLVARAKDADGLEGAPSAPLRLQVLGLSEGGPSPVDGVILLRRGQRLGLVGTTGLEMRYGNSPKYYRAGETVGLPGARPATVEFRDPREPAATVKLQLAPRLADATAAVGPVNATWPDTELELTVTLTSGAGQSLALSDGYRAEVSINRTIHPVVWKKTGASFTTRVQPQGGEGPWLVRLVVKDPKGHIVAQDFLEVTRSAPPRSLP